jgi:hypothetical protein
VSKVDAKEKKKEAQRDKSQPEDPQAAKDEDDRENLKVQ